MKRAIFAVISILLYASSSLAQTGTPTSWTLRVYQGATVIGSPTVVTTAQVQCNQTPPATTNNQNPTRWVWNDITNAGKVCIFDDAARLTGLGDGSYEGTASAANADGSSAETARIPFSRLRPNPPAVPTGLVITK